jgi:hypothetical protein
MKRKPPPDAPQVAAEFKRLREIAERSTVGRDIARLREMTADSPRLREIMKQWQSESGSRRILSEALQYTGKSGPATVAPVAEPKSKRRKHDHHASPQGDRIKSVLDAEWPNGVPLPAMLSNGAYLRRAKAAFEKAHGLKSGQPSPDGQPFPSDASFLRAAGRRKH